MKKKSGTTWIQKLAKSCQPASLLKAAVSVGLPSALRLWPGEHDNIFLKLEITSLMKLILVFLKIPSRNSIIIWVSMAYQVLYFTYTWQ